MRKLTVATRGSALALTQAKSVCAQLRERGVETELLVVETRGDQDREKTLSEIGGDGLFVRSIERTLLDGRADLAVHSAKDLPFALADGLVIAGTPKAADPRDVLIRRAAFEPGAGSVIGTGSARRRMEYAARVAGVQFAENRGNITTRIRKLAEGQFDAIILAKAGLDRLLEGDHATEETRAKLRGMLETMQLEVFDPDEMIPAPCQGILAVECRSEDAEVTELLHAISDPETAHRFRIEREIFCALGADCSTAVAVHAQCSGDALKIRARYGARRVIMEGTAGEEEALIRRVTNELRAGQVLLVGAGCGPGLITVRGLEAVRRADVLVYDDLIDVALLDETRDDCVLEYVGKRYGSHSKKQEEIHAILIRHASVGRSVVRLKGGDPFVFGRGGEEVIALREAGIPCEVIPGVSSAIAVPGHAGIPVTHRGVARSFTVITGHTADGTGENYEALAKLDGTLVFLMGLHAYPKITSELIRCGMDAGTPASVISQGFAESEQRIDGTLGTIAELAADAQTPAILVVGDVAAFAFRSDEQERGSAGGGEQLEWRTQTNETHLPEKPRVTVTGTESFAEKICSVLRNADFDAHTLPTIRIVPHPEVIPEELGAYDWIVLTSANAIRILFDVMRQRDRDIRSCAGLKFACIGSGTAEALLAHGIRADFVPERYTAEALGEGLARHIAGQRRPVEPSGRRAVRVLALRASNGSALLAEGLRKDGIEFTDLPLYDTEACMDGPASEDPYLVFGSAAGVQAYLGAYEIRDGQIPVCIGQYTAAALPEEVRTRALIATEHTAEGVLRVIERAEKGSAGGRFFPLFVDLNGKRVLIAGGGRIAERRTAALLDFGAEITVIAPEAGPSIRREAEAGHLRYAARPVCAEDVDGMDLVLAATDDGAVNQMLREACGARGIPFNRADDRRDCDFLFPGLVTDGDLVVGITSGGKDHGAVRAARERIGKALSVRGEEER